MTENEIIKTYLGLVIKIAKSFGPKNYDEMQECIQEGSVALLKALRAHDIKKGGKVSTLAWKYITRALIRYYNTQQKNKDKQSKLRPELLVVNQNKPTNPLWEILPSNLTNKENKIIQLRLEGYTFKEIGEKLHCTKGCAAHNFHQIINKIKIANE